MLDDLLEERRLFIGHEAAETFTHALFAQAWHRTEGHYAVVRHALAAAACVGIMECLRQMRERGEI
jgi:hypothetical protein